MNGPIIKTPSAEEEGQPIRETLWSGDLDLPPAKRELLLYQESKKELSELRVQHTNAQRLLRELYQLRKERFSSIINSIFATCSVSAGTWIAAGGATAELWFGAFATPVGGAVIVMGVVFGIVKPPLEAMIWARGHKHKSELQCPHCQKVVIHKD